MHSLNSSRPKSISRRTNSYKKNAVSYSGASSTVGDPVLFESKAFTIDCSSMFPTIQ